MQHFSRSDQRGCLTAIVIAALVGLGMALDHRLFSDGQLSTLDAVLQDSCTYTAYYPQTAHGDSYAPAEDNSHNGGGQSAAQQQELFSFDPNTADSIELVRLGFSPWQARSICNYRVKGGRFHRVEDMKRIYGMTPELYERICPYAHIAEQFRYYEDMGYGQAGAERRRGDDIAQNSTEGEHRTRQERLHEAGPIDLNTADTASLKLIPGIGDYRSQQIVSYRRALGGFVSVSQLAEIDGLPAGIEQYVCIGAEAVQRMNVNTATVRQMAAHPYLSYAQARAIEQYRRTNGRIRSLRQLQLLDEFSDFDFERLEPYVQY